MSDTKNGGVKPKQPLTHFAYDRRVLADSGHRPVKVKRKNTNSARRRRALGGPCSGYPEREYPHHEGEASSLDQC